MERFLGRFSEHAYALLRIVAGFLFMQHGLQKMFGMLEGPGPVALGSQMGVAGTIELVGGALILIGLFTGWAAFVASGLMAAAYFLAHSGRGFWPVLNQGELAALFCFVFLYIATRGGGLWSVDSLRGRRRRLRR
ncbi:MAG TPA: DoxX family protein [Thermoanaerobaculia bacterium]|nr:DoxX family protein [Thermoanaerobaculia bacterium]